ncbi:MAG: tetratricopeptide repeat protein [Gammaproteobacteria bacterium]|nr:tetratricopeptide repeat protein [Gammaproteobacteria bacterium]
MIVGVLIALSGCAAFAPRPTVSDAPVETDRAGLEHAAAAAYAAQDWAASERDYSALAAQPGSDAETWFKLANIYARTSRPDLAVRAYREAVNRDPKHARAWHNLGLIQLRLARDSFAEVERNTLPANDMHSRATELRSALDELLRPLGSATTEPPAAPSHSSR